MSKKLILFLVIEALCMGYLLWYYYLSPRYGYLQSNPYGFPAFILSGLFTLAFLVLGVRAFFAKNKLLPLLVAPTVWLLLVFEVFKSPVALYIDETDFSIHERLRLYENGTFDLQREAQIFTEYYKGTYLCRNDSVLLGETGAWNADSTKKILSEGNTVSFNNYQGAYLLHKRTIKKQNKAWWKVLFFKWLWIR